MVVGDSDGDSMGATEGTVVLGVSVGERLGADECGEVVGAVGELDGGII